MLTSPGPPCNIGKFSALTVTIERLLGGGEREEGVSAHTLTEAVERGGKRTLFAFTTFADTNELVASSKKIFFALQNN